MLLKDKNILVGVTGSIAIYKALELIREFVKNGANVKVVMSESAKKFITPLTFEALTRNRVLDEKSESWADENNHIDIGKWADIFVIAPATANTINKLNHGITDNLLLQTALAFRKMIILSPAANTNMITHNATKASLKMLKLLNYKIVEPVEKVLACGDEGVGALAEVKDIYYATVRELFKDEFWINRRVVVSGGGTIEKIDDVRYISNFSSGKMASNLALSLYLKGAEVCLVSSRFPIQLPSEVYTLDYEDSQELKDYLTDCIRVAKKGVITKPTLMDDSVPQNIQKTPYLFMAAAVSDYKPKYPQTGKLKKDNLGDEWDLKLVKNEDILSSLNKDGIITIGFKAEIDEQMAEKNAKKMLEEKKIDGVCLNLVSKNNFGSDENEIIFMTKEKEVKISQADKLQISLKLLDEVKFLDKSKNER